jgi:hypothetical protein
MMDRKPVPNMLRSIPKINNNNKIRNKINKFEKLVHLVGFIPRIYHDARSCECQIMKITLLDH